MRRRERAVVVEGLPIPAELLSRSDPTWASEALTDAWSQEHLDGRQLRFAVKAVRDGLTVPCWHRIHHDALHAWAERHGLMDGLSPDWHRLRAMGLFQATSLERAASVRGERIDSRLPAACTRSHGELRSSGSSDAR